MKSKNIIIALVGVLVVIAVGIGAFFGGSYHEKNKNAIHSIATASDLQKNLPLTFQTNKNATDVDSIGYLAFMAYFEPYQKTTANANLQLISASFNTFKTLSGSSTSDQLVVGTTFQLYPKKYSDKGQSYWGKVDDSGAIKNIYWEFHLIKKSKYTYVIKKVVPKSASKVTNGMIQSKIMSNHLQITLDSGTHWKVVPLTVQQLFFGEVTGNQSKLISGSYSFSKNRLALLYGKSGSGQGDDLAIYLSTNQGASWKSYPIKNQAGSIRMRKLGFTSAEEGYVILSGGRVMSQEGYQVLLTHDGGKTWSEAIAPATGSLMADGGFVSATNGFISLVGGSKGVASPRLWVTTDGAKSWQAGQIAVPIEFSQIFVQAETPFVEGDHLALYVNQGESGDYEGGDTKGKFISTDEGLTWQWDQQINPNEK